MINDFRERKMHIRARAVAFILAPVIAFSSSLTVTADDTEGRITSSRPASSNAITYEYYTQELKNVVPASWLFVGTYLMCAKAVTAQVYQSALESRDTYNQPIAYYRSELDGAKWKNIKDASSIDLILPSSEDVEETELFPYLITAVVGEDGIPRDPLTGDSIDIFKMISIYDMENIPELDAIEEYYNSGAVSWQDKGSKNYLYRTLYFFFENDTLDFDRESLDTAKLKQQYAALSADKGLLEQRWDEAYSKSPLVYPEEYRDIMTLMRNWPNIQDAVTIKSDEEMDNIHQMFLELFDRGMEEEADSALLVERQVDAARRAEVYYNLTSNDKLAGGSEVEKQEFEDEVALRKTQVNAQLAILNTQIDKEQSAITDLTVTVDSLENANAEIDSQISAENESFDALDTENRKAELSDELESLNGDFAPVKQQYEELNSKIDNILSETDEITGEVAALKKEKEDKLEAYQSRKAELEARIQELTDRYDAAKGKEKLLEDSRREYEEVKSYSEYVQESLLNESVRLEEYKWDADSYTKSRFTATVDSSKTYDPDKKTEADRRVEKQTDVVEDLKPLLDAARRKLNSLGETIASLEADLALEDEINALLDEYNELTGNGKQSLEDELARIDAGIDEKQGSMLAQDESGNSKLSDLKKAFDEASGIEESYREKKEAVETKNAELDELLKAEKKHEDKLAALKDKKEKNEKRIEGKNNCIRVAKAYLEELNKKADIIADEISKIEIYEDEEGDTPYTHSINLLNIEEASIKSQLAANDSIEKALGVLKAEFIKAEAENTSQMQDGEDISKDEKKILSGELKDINRVRTISTEVAEEVLSTTPSLEERLPRIEAALKDYQEKSLTYLKADKLSFAPTLYFLRDAAATGTPAYGRQFKYMNAYSGYSFDEDPDLTQLIEDAIKECLSARTEYEKKSIRRGETASDYAKYLLSRAVAANAPDIDSCMPYLQMLTDLVNINKDEKVHEDREIDLLYGWLLPFSMSDFRKNRTEESCHDYQFYIKALSDRESVQDAIIYVEGRLEYAYGIRNSFLTTGDGAVIESHIDWLENLLRALKERADTDEEEDDDDGLQSDLEEELERAIEEDDLVRAKKIEALLKMLADAQAAETGGEAGRDTVNPDLDETHAVSGRPDAESEILAAMLDSKDTEGYDVKGDIDRLVTVAADLGDAEDVLKQFGDDAVEYADRAKDKTAVPEGRQMSDSGKGLDTYRDLTTGEADDLIGDTFDNSNDAQKAAIVAYLADITYGDTDSGLYDYMRNLLDELIRNGSACIYRQYLDDRSTEYVSLAAVDNCRMYTGFRYVRKDGSADITMSQINNGSASYTFTVGKTLVAKNSSDTDNMDKAAGEHTDEYLRRGSNEKYCYITEDFARKYMGCGCAYVDNTDWAILITPGMDQIITEIAGILGENAKKE